MLAYSIPLAGNEQFKHRLGVNALFIPSKSLTFNSYKLFTGGRDGLVCGFQIDTNATVNRNSGNSITCTSKQFKATESHIDWVNALCGILNDTYIVSGSSDGCLHIHDTQVINDSDYFSVHSSLTLGNAYEMYAKRGMGKKAHTDFVKALASSNYSHNFVSAGLDKQILLWDARRMQKFLSMNVDNVIAEDEQLDYRYPSLVFQQSSNPSSIYALDCCPDFSLVASGGPDKAIRMFDPRSGKPTSSLVGHTDTVRSLIFGKNGRSILSASSDGTIRLWSLMTNRVIRVFNEFEDSVWCLSCPSREFSQFVAGSRSGAVIGYDFHDNGDYFATLIAQESSGGVTSVAMNDDGLIWCSTANSSNIKAWRDLRKPVNSDSDNLHSQIVGQIDRISINAPKEVFKNDLSAKEAKPSHIISGLNGIVKYAVMDNRRMVVTEDCIGQVAAWDLLGCDKVQDIVDPNENFNDAVSRISKKVQYCPSWCSIDIKSGQISVMLECPRCFDSEVYADELFETASDSPQDDFRMNIGKVALHILFEKWAKKCRSLPESENGKLKSNSRKSSGNNPSLYSSSFLLLRQNEANVIVTILDKPESEFVLNCPVYRLRIDEIASFSPTYISWCPKWIFDCIVNDEIPPKDVVKLAFQVLPSNDSGLEPLAESKLTTNRMLRLRKIMQYIVDRTPSIAQYSDIPAEKLLEMTCQEKIIPPKAYLLTIKNRYSPSTDLVITYSPIKQ